MFDADVLNAAVDLIMWIIVVLAMLLLYKSVPADKIAEGIEIAKKGAAKTETKIDDSMVQFVEQLYLAWAAQRLQVGGEDGVIKTDKSPDPVRDKTDDTPI